MPTMTNHDQTGSPNTAPADRDWFGGRRWTGIGAIALLIVVLVCALIVVIASHRSGHLDPTIPPAGQSPAPGTTRAPSPGASALPTAVPTVAPAGTVWTLWRTVALPTVVGAGPARISGSAATGYARSPIGALAAVANIFYRYTFAPDTDWRAAADAMLAPGAGKDAWVKFRAASPQGDAPPASGTLTQIAGFQFVSYTPADAVIQLATRDSDGNFQVATAHVTWVASDWKLNPAANGGPSATSQTIDTLSGFIPWSGV